MTEPKKETAMSRIRRIIDTITGRSDERAAEAAEARAKAAHEKLSRVPRHRVRALVGASALLAAALALPGCSALAQALGVDPRATAPAYSGVGVVMLASPNGRVAGVKTDQSGAVGATGSASTDADQTSTAEIPAEAMTALVSAAQALIAEGKPEAAAAVLGAVAPKKAAAKPAAAPPAAPAPAPAAPTAPESPAVPAAPPAPAGGTAAPPVEPVK